MFWNGFIVVGIKTHTKAQTRTKSYNSTVNNIVKYITNKCKNERLHFAHRTKHCLIANLPDNIYSPGHVWEADRLNIYQTKGDSHTKKWNSEKQTATILSC